MATDLKKCLIEQLAPDGIWTMRDGIKSLIQRLMRRLPRGYVSEQDRRYPTTQKGMRAFIDVLFARHFFQIQDSLLEHVSSDDFLHAIESGRLHVVDIGSGPAVATLAITDMLNVALGRMVEIGTWPAQKPLRMSIVLNDTSELSLDIGKYALNQYYQMVSTKPRLLIERILTFSHSFPDSIVNLKRVAKRYGPYDISCFSYVLVPLEEKVGLATSCNGITQIEEVCNPSAGQILIIQDKFHEPLLKRTCRWLKVRSNMATTKQLVYNSENQNSQQTYTFGRALYQPRKSALTLTA